MSTSSTSQPPNGAGRVETNSSVHSSAQSIAVDPSPLSTSTTAPSASPPIVSNTTPSTTTPQSHQVGGTNGVASTQQPAESNPISSLPPPAQTQSTSQSNPALLNHDQPPPAVPLEDQEMLAFGTVAEQEILPPPPRDPNAPLMDTTGGGQENGGSKRSMGTGATAAAGPLARAKRPKNVKFSPAKIGKQLARRAAAPGVGGGEVLLANNDYCDSCGGKGHFLCCEGGCLRSFHFGCLEPPLEIDEVPEESWFCKACRAKAHPPTRPAPGFFSELIYNVERENPKAFSLNNDIKQFYKNVAVGLNGEFIDSNEHRPPSKITGRAVGQEDRDGYRLKDKNGKAIICYNCSQAANPHIHRRIISCDFCDQHWHLDCLNPPMTGMPPPTRKWMCPVHSEHVLPKKRVPRASSTVNIEERGVPNNGDIIVLPPPERAPPEEYEEMTVNRIRYQVPEQNIILDFWGKVVPPSRRGELGKKAKKRASPRKKRAMGNGCESGNSSPLTDLTSSEDEDMEMADRRGSSRKREGSNIASATTSALDNLALLAEVRYIDMLNNPSPQPSTSSVSDRKASVSSTTRNGPRPSLPLPSSSSAAPSAPAATSSSASNPRFSLGAIPPFSGNASTGQAASPTTSSIPLSASTSATGGRHGSPSLSPAPGSARAAPPQSELTVQSKEDLKALMQVRKLLLSQGQAPGSAKTTMLSFLEGAPIIPKLAFVNNGKASPWQRPWDTKKDGPRPSGSAQPSTPSASTVSQNPPKPASPAPLTHSTAADPLSKSIATKSTTTTASPAIKVESVSNVPRQSQRPSPPLPQAAPYSPDNWPSAAAKRLAAPSDPYPSSGPSQSPVLSSHHIPTPYSSDMPFQLPAFRPPSATPPTPRTDAMDIDKQTKK